MEGEKLNYKVEVYIDDGRVFIYEVESAEKVREHSSAIILSGYRHVQSGTLEHYPPHRILKVKCRCGMDTQYPDVVRGT